MWLLQWASLAGLLIFTFEFFVQFFICMASGSGCFKHEKALGGVHTPAFKGTGQYQVLGMAIFAYAYVTTIPSWANEKRPS